MDLPNRLARYAERAAAAKRQGRGRELATAVWDEAIYGVQLSLFDDLTEADVASLQRHMAETAPGIAAPAAPALESAAPVDTLDAGAALTWYASAARERLAAVNAALADVAAGTLVLPEPTAWTLAGLHMEAAIHNHVSDAVGAAVAAATNLYGEAVTVVTGQPWPRVRILGSGRVRDPVDIAADVEAATLEGRHVTNPLTPLVRCWSTHYRAPARQHTRPLLPAEWPKEERRQAAYAVAPGVGQLPLPAAALGDNPHLPDHLYRVGVARVVDQRGRVAPLALRIFLEGQLGVAPERRQPHMAQSVDVTVRQLLAWLYPGPGRRPAPSRWRPALEAAAEALASRQAAIAGADGRPWWPVLLHSDLAGLDSPVRLEVTYPPSDRPNLGAPIWIDDLREAGVRSAVQHRLLITLAYRWWQPGVTRLPVHDGRRKTHWTDAKRLEAWPHLDGDDLVHAAYPSTTARMGTMERRNQLAYARRAIEGLAGAGAVRLEQDTAGLTRIPPPPPLAG